MKEKAEYYIVPYIVSVTSYPVLVKIHVNVTKSLGVGIVWVKPSDNRDPGRAWSIRGPLSDFRVRGPFTNLAEAKNEFIVYLL
jgi:hypothetical protein